MPNLLRIAVASLTLIVAFAVTPASAAKSGCNLRNARATGRFYVTPARRGIIEP